jgi:predicted MPP superfamily phosphohydrolase
MYENILLLVGIFVLVLVIIYGIEIRHIIRYLIARRKNQPSARLSGSPLMMLNHIAAIIGVVCMLYGYLIEPYRLEIATVRIETDKLAVPLRIVQISDLHCERTARLEPLLAQSINPLNPDVIVFTGDAINEPGGLELFRKTLAGLHASIGKFAVTGNWDDLQMTNLDRFAETGFDVLDQDVRFLEKNGETFCVAGLGYLNGRHSGPVITKLKPDIFTVFLYHTPDFVVWLKGLPVDLYLCGHTHGGQVALPFLGPVITLSSMGRPYGRGLNQYENIITYTNRGIGMDGGHAPRVRFLARPEITVFEIVPKAEDK